MTKSNVKGLKTAGTVAQLGHARVKIPKLMLVGTVTVEPLVGLNVSVAAEPVESFRARVPELTNIEPMSVWNVTDIAPALGAIIKNATPAIRAAWTKRLIVILFS
jgi:hypothetical protein